MSGADIAKQLKINKSGVEKGSGLNKTYIIDLDSSDEFGEIYSLLDRNDELIYDDESSLLTTENGSLIYQYLDNIRIILIADFDNDQYKVTIKGY